jgi:hypothetical protein
VLAPRRRFADTEKTMSSKSELARTTALALLPLAAFLFGPVLDEMAAPESIPTDVLNSVLPTVFPLAALVVVAVVSYHRTGSAARALRITSLAFAVAALGALAYLIHVWSEASGS